MAGAWVSKKIQTDLSIQILRFVSLARETLGSHRIYLNSWAKGRWLYHLAAPTAGGGGAGSRADQQP